MLYYFLWVANYDKLVCFFGNRVPYIATVLYIVTTKLFCTLTNKCDANDIWPNNAV